MRLMLVFTLLSLVAPAHLVIPKRTSRGSSTRKLGVLAERPVAIIELADGGLRYPVAAGQELSRKNGRRVAELLVDIPPEIKLDQTMGLETDRGVYLATKDSDLIKHGWRALEFTLSTDHPLIGVGLPLPQIVAKLNMFLNPPQPIAVAGVVVSKTKTEQGKWQITIETDQEPPATVGTKAIIEYSAR